MTDRLKPLAWAAYGVAALLIIIPVTDTVLGLLPPRPDQVTWRFGALGLASRAVMTPLFGMLIALVTAALLEHRRTGRFLSVLSFVGVAAMIGAVLLFGLDALQTRAQVRPEAATAFDTASAVALAKYLAGGVVALLLGIGGWKASRRSGGAMTKRDRPVANVARAEEPRVLIANVPPHTERD